VDVTIAISPRAPHQVRHAEALREGFKRHGLAAEVSHGARHDAKTVVCWGWRNGKAWRAQGKSVLVMERGYIGDRMGVWSSLAWNGLNGHGKVAHIPDDGGARFNRCHPGALKEWNPSGDYALIVGQVPGDSALYGKDLSGWYAAQAAKDWGMPVYFRPHPLAHRRGPVKSVPGAPKLDGDLREALTGAACVVTYNSNTAVDSLLAGKPTYVDDPGSMAWEVEDRETWAHRLAWRQWTIDEFADGTALEYVGVTDGE
jgi:hypothetical protein